MPDLKQINFFKGRRQNNKEKGENIDKIQNIFNLKHLDSCGPDMKKGYLLPRPDLLILNNFHKTSNTKFTIKTYKKQMNISFLL